MRLTCREIYAFLDEYLDGHLDPMTRVAFGAHLVLCSKCRKYLATYRATIQAAGDAELTDDPKDVPAPEELIQAILSVRRADPAQVAE